MAEACEEINGWEEHEASPTLPLRGSGLAGSVSVSSPSRTRCQTHFRFQFVQHPASTTSHVPALHSTLLSRGTMTPGKLCLGRAQPQDPASQAQGSETSGLPQSMLSRLLAVGPSPPLLPSQGPALLCTSSQIPLTTDSVGLSLESFQVLQASTKPSGQQAEPRGSKLDRSGLASQLCHFLAVPPPSGPQWPRLQLDGQLPQGWTPAQCPAGGEPWVSAGPPPCGST